MNWAAKRATVLLCLASAAVSCETALADDRLVLGRHVGFRKLAHGSGGGHGPCMIVGTLPPIR